MTHEVGEETVGWAVLQSPCHAQGHLVIIHLGSTAFSVATLGKENKTGNCSWDFSLLYSLTDSHVWPSLVLSVYRGLVPGPPTEITNGWCSSPFI